MARIAQEPTLIERKTSHSEQAYEHPAFAQIGASRVSGGAYLYDSDFQHQHYITITISTSELHRSLSRDWHFGGKELIEVALSEAQWATFVSSMNQGSGVPCTLQHLQGVSTPGLPAPVSQTDKFSRELKSTMTKAMDDLAKALDSLGGPLSKKQATEVQAMIRDARMQIMANMPYVAECFEEHLETTIEKAKIEVNAYATASIQRAGLQSIAKDQAVSWGQPLVIENQEKDK